MEVALGILASKCPNRFFGSSSITRYFIQSNSVDKMDETMSDEIVDTSQGAHWLQKSIKYYKASYVSPKYLQSRTLKGFHIWTWQDKNCNYDIMFFYFRIINFQVVEWVKKALEGKVETAVEPKYKIQEVKIGVLSKKYEMKMTDTDMANCNREHGQNQNHFPSITPATPLCSI